MKRVPVAISILLIFSIIAALGIFYAKTTCNTMSQYALDAQESCERNDQAICRTNNKQDVRLF